MKKALLIVLMAASTLAAQKRTAGVSTENLERPAPEDWLMYSRTYDAQRFSPLEFINRRNVPQLKTAWTKAMPNGNHESIPIVHDDVMYLVQPGAGVVALNAATGDQIWEYKRDTSLASRTKTLAIYRDMVYYAAPDGFIVALDASTGKVRWETKTDGGMTSGPVVIEGKVLTGRTCAASRKNCYISAHDALTGAEAWKFYTAAGDDDPGGASWAGAPDDKRFASTWGLPGNYDPALKLIYWGVANPTPNTRMERHAGKFDAIPFTSPADLYSNSTLAINPATGKLVWYYQHLPGDDWDEDYTHERTLLRTAVRPDPKFVKWINPDIRRGEQRDVAVMVGEGGGVFTLDRRTGQFLWATPFPFDAPNFLISNIDGKTSARIGLPVIYARTPYFIDAVEAKPNVIRSAIGPRKRFDNSIAASALWMINGMLRRLAISPPGTASPRCPPSAAAFRATGRSRRSSAASPESTWRRAKSSTYIKVGPRATAPYWPPPAIWCSGAIWTGNSVHSTRRAERFSGKRRWAVRSTTVPFPTPSTASSTSPS